MPNQKHRIIPIRCLPRWWHYSGAEMKATVLNSSGGSDTPAFSSISMIFISSPFVRLTNIISCQSSLLPNPPYILPITMVDITWKEGFFPGFRKLFLACDTAAPFACGGMGNAQAPTGVEKKESYCRTGKLIFP